MRSTGMSSSDFIMKVSARSSEWGAFGTRLTDFTSMLSRHMGFGISQQMLAMPPQEEGTSKVAPMGRSLGTMLGPSVEKNSNSDLVARNWIAFSCRSLM